MRLFELILLLLTVILSIWNIFFSKKYLFAFRIMIAINTIILIFHVIVEGMRWQMALVYGILLYLLTLNTIKYFTQKAIIMKKGLRLLLRAVTILAFIISLALVYLFPIPKLPKPNGEYTVSTMRYHLVDQSREEIYTKEVEDKRELMLTIWYPSKEDKKYASKPYITEFNLFRDTITKAAGLPGFLFDHFRYIKTYATVGAPVSDKLEKYPIIIFSHGLGTSPIIYTSIIEELASHGYIVAAVDHTYSTMATTFTDQKVTAFETNMETYTEEEAKQLVDTWVEDIDFVLNTIEQMNADGDTKLFLGKFDLTKVGVVGHSFGGAAAFQSCYIDERIKASVNLDGTTHSQETGLSIEDKNFMFIASEDYSGTLNSKPDTTEFADLSESQRMELMEQGITESQYDQLTKQLEESYVFLQSIMKNGGFYLSIDGTEHYNFSDVPFMSPLASRLQMTGDIDKHRGLDIINTYMLAFFDQFLKDKDSDLLMGPSEYYPEVKFE